MPTTIVIRDVDERTYRAFKGEAARRGLKMGDAATEAFRSWTGVHLRERVRDIDRMKRAARRMDERRARLGPVEGWSSVEEIRKWRELRRP